MTKTNNFIKNVILKPVKITALALLIVPMVFLPSAQVRADSFDDQIRALQQEIAGFQDQASALRAQADTLQNQLDALNADMTALQNQINLKETELAQINDTIVKTEQRLVNQKQLLGGNLRSMYLDSQITPLEMVASSKSISDFIDKQEYRNKIRDQVAKSIVEIKQLKEDLAKQKIAAEQVLADQKSQRADLATKQGEQANLLAATQGQEAKYQQLSKERNAQVAGLRAAQIAANARSGGNVVAGDPNHGGYPKKWDNAPLDAYVDNWGMYSRECVSYTAYRVWASGRHMPYWGGHGNANQWDNNAIADGIPTGSQPKVGSVAIDNGGPYGHSMYVEAVLDNGQIYVSQYNYSAPGAYSEMTRSASGLVYIYF